MSLASVIISALIIFIVLMVFSFSKNLPANIRNSSGGASTPPSSSSSSATPTPSSPAPAGKGGGNWQDKARGMNWSVILLGIAGVYLLARMTVLGGVLPVEEILILAVITGIAFALNRKLGVFALLIAGILLVNFFHPNVNQDVKGVREAQLNPPGEMAPIVIDHDDYYNLPPDRSLQLCFTKTTANGLDLVHKVSIGGKLFLQEKDGCQDIPETLRGKVFISLISGQPYSAEVKNTIGRQDIRDNYRFAEWKTGIWGYPKVLAK